MLLLAEVSHRYSCTKAVVISKKWSSNCSSLAESLEHHQSESDATDGKVDGRVTSRCTVPSPSPPRLAGAPCSGHFRPSDTLRARQTRGKSPYQTGHSTSSALYLYLYKHTWHSIRHPKASCQCPSCSVPPLSSRLLLGPVPTAEEETTNKTRPEWNEQLAEEEKPTARIASIISSSANELNDAVLCVKPPWW
jgi:hypothetical protein